MAPALVRVEPVTTSTPDVALYVALVIVGPAVSSSVIVPVAVDVPSVALLGPDRVTVNVSSVVSVVSPAMVTLKVLDVSPGVKLRKLVMAV